MAQRAAIVTGGSSGIGLAIARMLVQEGYGVTIASRRPEKLAEAAQQLTADGGEVAQVAGNMASEEVVAQVVAEHQERFGRLDVLVNNAGVGVGALVADIETKRLDMQLAVNLRSVILFYREAAALLRAAGAEHRNALGRQHVVDLGQVRRAVAVCLLRHQGGRRRFHRGDEQGARDGRDQVHRPVPGVRGHPETDFIKQNVAAATHPAGCLQVGGG